MSDHDPKDMMKTTSDAENVSDMDEKKDDEVFDKMIEDLVHVESRPPDEMPVIPLGEFRFSRRWLYISMWEEKNR